MTDPKHQSSRDAYARLLPLVEQDRQALADLQKKLEAIHLSPQQIANAMDPALQFHQRLLQELESLERRTHPRSEDHGKTDEH